MLESIREILVLTDYIIWYYLNTVWTSDFLDAVIPYFRNQWTWAPLYLFLLVFMVSNFRLTGFIWCLFFLATFGLSDQLSASLFKELFQRLRPCNNPHLQSIVHIIVPCGSGYSFPSSHATNHFALAVFSLYTMRGVVPGIKFIALFWAALVSYSQVYVGVHFPLDIFCGGLLGTVCGMLTSRLFHLRFSLPAALGEDPLLKSPASQPPS